MSRPVVLITGPTSGLGEGYARRFARDGHNLVLVARDVDRLVALAGELRAAHRIDVEVLPADLADSAARARVADRLAAGVQVLVNNAGLGTGGEFWTAELGLLRRQLDVNVTAVMELTHAALPSMLAARTGTVIINSAVRVSPAAVSHGNLIVTFSESPQVSQPQPKVPVGGRSGQQRCSDRPGATPDHA